jgi:1-deoxy-D-xylulose-5-phosphate reductoisomerase
MSAQNIVNGSAGKARMRVAVLGSTGSIGLSTLDVLSRHPDRFEVFALTANSNVARLREQCLAHRPRFAVMVDAVAAARLTDELRSAGSKTHVLAGQAALSEVAAHEDVDAVMAAIVGAAGLRSSLAAARAGKRIMLANKEALVMSGPLFMQAVREGGATLLPVDSEHNAVFQCMSGPGATPAGVTRSDVRRVLLTASGGPFLRTPASALRTATPEQACAHPRWVMGRKISVDSATLMNKGLEQIEACLLFALPPAQVEVVVHPQSIVHSLVEYVDGSMLAQLGNPDMRTPIAHALGWPERIASGVESLDILKAARLDFEAPDAARFPCLGLARAAAEAGGTAPAVLNAANEVAVEAFLQRRLSFPEIADVIERVLARHPAAPAGSLDDVLSADDWARREAHAALRKAAGVCA